MTHSNKNSRFNSVKYQEHIEYEKKFYNSDLFKNDLTEETSSGLTYVLDAFQNRVKRAIGKDVWEYTISAINKRIDIPVVKILSIGSGPGGTEMNLAKRFTVNYSIDCIDINEKLLKLGKQKADSEGLKLNFIQQDINQLKLKNENYDIVFAHASLHHMINHEHIAEEVKKSMKPNAEYIIYDITCRNGMRIWPETKKIANKLWSLIPLKYKSVPNSKNKTKFFTELRDEDLSKDGFECIRSQDLYGVLKQNFRTEIEVPGFSFTRRFVDNTLGCNYDIKNNPFDQAVLDTIISLDEKYTKSYKLKPESVFLVLK